MPREASRSPNLYNPFYRTYLKTLPILIVEPATAEHIIVSVRYQQRLVAASDIILRTEDDTDHIVDGAYAIYACASLTCERVGGGGQLGDVRNFIARTEPRYLRDALKEELTVQEQRVSVIFTYDNNDFSQSMRILDRALALNRRAS